MATLAFSQRVDRNSSLCFGARNRRSLTQNYIRITLIRQLFKGSGLRGAGTAQTYLCSQDCLYKTAFHTCALKSQIFFKIFSFVIGVKISRTYKIEASDMVNIFCHLPFKFLGNFQERCCEGCDVLGRLAGIPDFPLLDASVTSLTRQV